MISKNFSAIAVAGLVAFTSASAFADTGVYAKVGGAYVEPTSKAKDTEIEYNNEYLNYKAKHGYMFNLAVGYKVQNNVRAELDLSFGKTKYEFKAEDANVKLSAKNVTTLVNAYYDFDVHEYFKPYVMAGLGVSKNTPKLSGDLEYIGKVKSTSRFAYNAGIGAQFPFNETVALDLGVKYFDFGKITKKGGINGNIRGFAVTTGVAINF